jgi:zinc/manganese transport system substrate-binding protein
MAFNKVCILALAALAGISAPGAAGSPIRVTTTLEVLRALVETVGGDRVKVEAIAAPQFDPHFIEPRPSDIVRLGRSNFFAHMGLDLELWRGPLVEAAVNSRLLPGGAGEIDCSAGISLLEVPQRAASRAEGDIHLFGNPHYWLDPANAARMAERIAGPLGEYVPAGAADFQERAARFGREIEERQKNWQALLAPYQGARLAAYHNSWPYFAKAFGLRIDLFLEPKPGIPPSGVHLETLANTMRQEKVRLIVLDRYQPRRMAESLAQRTGARLVELWQNPDPKMGYLELMDRNVRVLAEALGTGGGGQR